MKITDPIGTDDNCEAFDVVKVKAGRRVLSHSSFAPIRERRWHLSKVFQIARRHAAESVRDDVRYWAEEWRIRRMRGAKIPKFKGLLGVAKIMDGHRTIATVWVPVRPQ